MSRKNKKGESQQSIEKLINYRPEKFLCPVCGKEHKWNFDGTLLDTSVISCPNKKKVIIVGISENIMIVDVIEEKNNHREFTAYLSDFYYNEYYYARSHGEKEILLSYYVKMNDGKYNIPFALYFLIKNS